MHQGLQDRLGDEARNRRTHWCALHLPVDCPIDHEQLELLPPISGFIAEAVLQRLKLLVFQRYKPKFWARYVDDTFVVIKRDQVLTFQEHLNVVFLDIQFRMEEEKNNQLAFLDVLVCRNDCGGLNTKVFRKATNTMQCVSLLSAIYLFPSETAFTMVILRNWAPVVNQGKRLYSLNFHRHQILSLRQKIWWCSISFAVVPASIWSYFFYKRQEHKRKLHEEEFGRPFFKPFPRTHKPFPWGNGETPFFQTMKTYWGFTDEE
nr:unnamed protein product [Spirometra erinaceieuropaei]